MSHLTPEDSMSRPASLPVRTQSWPGKASKVPGWRRGRTEVMEDALEEMGHASLEDVGTSLAARMRTLDLGRAASAREADRVEQDALVIGEGGGRLLSELLTVQVEPNSGQNSA